MNTTVSNAGIPAARMRILLLLLPLMPLVMVVVAIVMRSGPNPVTGGIGNTLAWVALGMTAMELPIGLLVRRGLTQRAADHLEESCDLLEQGQVPGPLFSRGLVSAAMAEGVGLFAVIAYMLGGPIWILAVMALSVLVILLQLPNTKGMIEELRDLARSA